MEHESNSALLDFSNPHILWRQLLGLALWTILPGYLLGGIIGAFITLILGGLTFIDTWNSGIWKDPENNSFTNLSPMGWGVAMALLLIITYPAYCLIRNKKAVIPFTKGYYFAVIVIGGLALFSGLLNILINAGIINA
ncbi:MAG: hypothetical protein GY829_15445 [Gammaproteobacteria bacterium]|nr:hypothetical protein [Gammaproteobacteria bacterium]